METIKQILTVPADSRLSIDLPRHIPEGTTVNVTVAFEPPGDDDETPFCDRFCGALHISAERAEAMMRELREGRGH